MVLPAGKSTESSNDAQRQRRRRVHQHLTPSLRDESIPAAQRPKPSAVRVSASARGAGLWIWVDGDCDNPIQSTSLALTTVFIEGRLAKSGEDLVAA